LEGDSTYYTEGYSALQISPLVKENEPVPEETRRPLRADARRNYERLVAAASEVIAEQGPDGSLEEIARRAEVGVGTLYRHFPTRDDLLEATFSEQLRLLSAMAVDLLEHPDPAYAVRAWLWASLQHTRRNHSLGAAVVTRLTYPAAAKQALLEAGQALLDQAKAAGCVQSDCSVDHAMTLVCGIAMATSKANRDPSDPYIEQCFDIAMRGIQA
jgi:AcrR family transcriptional regulator